MEQTQKVIGGVAWKATAGGRCSRMVPGHRSALAPCLERGAWRRVVGSMTVRLCQDHMGECEEMDAELRAGLADERAVEGAR